MAKGTSSNGSQTVFIILGVVIFVALIGMLFSFTPMPCTRFTKRDLEVIKDLKALSQSLVGRGWNINSLLQNLGDYKKHVNLYNSFNKVYLPEQENFAANDAVAQIAYIYRDDRFVNFLYKFTFCSNLKKLASELGITEYKTCRQDANKINEALTTSFNKFNVDYQKYIDSLK